MCLLLKSCVQDTLRALLLILVVCSGAALSQAAEPLSILFLGDKGPHQPKSRAAQLIPELDRVGIKTTYTSNIQDINKENLARFDVLLVYANIDEINSTQSKALLEYVANGGGFVPLHCASFCFRNDDAIVNLIGAQFERHGGQVFSTKIVQPTHPIMQGFSGFESWDETYIHTKHNERNRIVLEVRRQGGQAEGRLEEPWTWVRTHGKGRVFYTAWGHDERTWGHPGFINLVERGIRWTAGQNPAIAGEFQQAMSFPIPKMKSPNSDVTSFEYVDVGPKIPNYLPSNRWGTAGENFTRMQKPLSPKESIKHYVTPENFHLELVASEPSFEGKPIAMNWDHRGRMWVCETVDYPNELMPPGEGRDRIRICEDTDGDFVMDKFTIYAEDLSIPTSIEFYRDGVIVQAGIETLFLRDRDGDDIADERQVLISGWQMGDTHGGVSNFQYGLDNQYWAMQGYNDSKPVFGGGKHQGFRQGPFRFRVEGESTQPQVSSMEFIRSTTNNSWGLGISEEGLIFASTANRAPSFFVPIPNRYYEAVRGWTPRLIADAIANDHLFDPVTTKVRQMDHHGGYTAGAGHALYTARNYPESWWNRTAFVCGPTGHLVGTFVLEKDGSTFADKNSFNLVASDDEWAAPIMAEVGPDGNVWILDWYNFIVQHNPTPKGFKTGKGNAYETDLRDKTHGRIYRLVYDGPDGQQSASIPNLDLNDPNGLVSALAHPNRLWRRHAQRLLVERGKTDVVEAIEQLLADSSSDPTGNNAGAIHALWTLHGLGALENPASSSFSAAIQALSHASPGVRRNAALVLPKSTKAVEAVLSASILEDNEIQVQLAGLMMLADQDANGPAGIKLAELASTSMEQDRYWNDGLICAASGHAVPFLIANAKDSSSSTPASILSIVAEHLARSDASLSVHENLLSYLPRSTPPVRNAIIQGLANGWPRHNSDSARELSSAMEASLSLLLEKASPKELGALLKFGKALGSKSLNQHLARLSDELFASLEDDEATDEQRAEAAGEIVSLMGSRAETIAELAEVITPQTPPQVSSSIVKAMAGADAPNTGEVLIETWQDATPKLRSDILTVLMSRPSSTTAMLESMEKGDLFANDLTLEQRQTLSSHPERNIRRLANRVLRASGGNVNADRQRVIEAYTVSTEKIGDASQGKELFVKNCATCHKHSGEGKEIGPDLTGMAVHPKEELLIHILDPSRSVEANFRKYTLLTVDGQVQTGMLAAESLSAVELIDSEGKTHAISREDIEELTASSKSMMPEGFEQQMNPAQMTDLLEFLTKKGKFVPLPLAKVATAISTKGLFHSGDNGPDRMVFRDWEVKEFKGIPFQLVDPKGKTIPNIVLLNGPQGSLPPKMPREVSLPCNMVIKSIHLLSGVSGWGYPAIRSNSTSMIVRFHYEDGTVEDHPLQNGVHFADYIRRTDVPKSEFAFALGGQQIRYLSVQPKERKPILSVNLVKGTDRSAPIVMAVSAEQYE